MSRRPVVLLGASLLAGACALQPVDDLEALRPGLFVAASGPGDGSVVDAVAAEPRTSDDKPDKVELSAPALAAGAGELRVLDNTFVCDERTAYETADKRPGEAFLPQPGQWLRLKSRRQPDGSLRARTVREFEPRDRFKVVGELQSIDTERRLLDIGGVVLPLAQDVDLDRSLAGNDPLALFLADDQKTVPFGLRLGDRVRLGGQAAAEFEYDDEFDLDAARDRDRSKPAGRGKLDAFWDIDGRGSYALGEVAFGRDDTIRENGVDTYEERLEVTRAFASVNLGAGLQVLVGRQDFDEGREWLYDEVLDGVRAIWRTDGWRCEVAAARGREGLAEPNGYEETGVLLATLHHQPTTDWQIGAYVLQRTDDTGAGFEPLLFGVQSLAEPRQGFGHWLEAGFARGDDGARAIRGHAFDVGVRWTFDAAWRPTLAAGYAFANGRDAGATTTGYRQSGLQDNNGKLGGVTSVRYYGELFDPELANLAVATLAVAVRPLRNLSVSALLHDYRQDVASTVLVDTALRASPTGLSRDLGRELDLVLGYRAERRLTLELVLGRFEPGDAFAGDTAATLLAFTTRLSF